MDPRTKKIASTFVEEIQIKHKGTISILSPYVSSKKKVKCSCNVCGNRWSTIPGSLKKRAWGSKCSSKSVVAKLSAKIAATFVKDIENNHNGKIVYV